jgi:hypothetical protein
VRLQLPRGRCIPGPPSVCAEEGLNYCAYRDEGFGRGCRAITIEREDGSIRRIRRCD